jgi:pimeloyl-ACP methyl ester carboxylesterase
VANLDVPIDTGSGAPVVLLHGYAMRPATYGGLVKLLAPRCRVIVPDLFAIKGRWSYPEVLHSFTSTLDDLGVDRVTLIGHSFGGGLELGFAAEWPKRIVDLVFSDTLGVSREWGLAEEALRHPGRLTRLATPRAASAFFLNLVTHPRQLADGAWWAFTSDRNPDAAMVGADHVRSHVLWANRDSILARSDGMRFAERLGATFTVASPPDGRAVDHDWMFEQPKLFVDHLDALGLQALRSDSSVRGQSSV